MNHEFQSPILLTARLALIAASLPMIILYSLLSIAVLLFAIPAAIGGSIGNLGFVLLWLFGSFAIGSLAFSAATFGRRDFSLATWQVIGLILGKMIAIAIQVVIWSDSASFNPLIHKAPAIAAFVAAVILVVSVAARCRCANENGA
jgi:hypothetical protein